MLQNMEKQSPKVLGGGARTSSDPHYRDEKNTPFHNLFSTQNGKFKFKDLNELELELELEQKNSGDAAWRPGPCSQFKLFTFRQ